MAINKVVYGSQVLIDLTGDTVTSDKLLSGFTAHGKDGSPIEGTCTFDVDSQDATAAVAEILVGKTAYARGALLTGTMPNNGSVSGEISTKDGQYSIPQGYHDGGGKVGIAATEQSNRWSNLSNTSCRMEQISSVSSPPQARPPVFPLPKRRESRNS